MRSMTGYGRGDCSTKGFKFIVELNSVNRKQSDISLNLPKQLVELEPQIRDEINAQISRGRINAVIEYHCGAGKASERIELDLSAARAYLGAIKKLQKEMKLDGVPRLDTLLRAPGVLTLVEPTIDPQASWPSLRTALRKALAALVKMRSREGRFLACDLDRRVRLLAAGQKRIRHDVPKTLQRYREQLQARVKESGLSLPLDDERLLKEVVIFADRCDISEELTRLDSHLKQFRAQLKSNEPVGRTLDFLSQELNRELNTIGSKANAAEISQQVVRMKAELEKIREQIQNIE